MGWDVDMEDGWEVGVEVRDEEEGGGWKVRYASRESM